VSVLVPNPPDINLFAGRLAEQVDGLMAAWREPPSRPGVARKLDELAPYQDRLMPEVSDSLASRLEALSARALKYAAVFRGQVR
jgi:hypothetical protein